MTLTAKGLTLGYGERRVIDGLDLTFPQGQVITILGPNGCGKSTLLRALGRLLKPVSGQVTFNDDDISRLDSRALARRMAILPQSPLAPEGITVGDLVRRGRLPWRGMFSPWNDDDRAACDEALRAVGLTDAAHRPLEELSGGQRQRAWIALVLAQQASLLLLDEPTTYLDLTHQLEVLGLLHDRNRSTGLSVISVLHDLNLAARFSDRLVLLGRNGLVAEGRPHTVMTPANLEQAFGLHAEVHPDPITGAPMVFPL